MIELAGLLMDKFQKIIVNLSEEEKRAVINLVKALA
jgi:hypothetical protein